jgi:hypothetical protein
MVVSEDGRRVKIPKTSVYARLVRIVVEAYVRSALTDGGTDAPPSRNDVKKLWRELHSRHKEVLGKIAAYANGISQKELENTLDIEAEDLRGRNTGLSRICSRLNVDYPIHQTGYTRDNRRFHLNPDVAKTVLDLVRRERD